MVGRRGFLQSIGAAVLGLSLALRGPEQPCYLHPDDNQPVTITLSDQFNVGFEWTELEATW